MIVLTYLYTSQISYVNHPILIIKLLVHLDLSNLVMAYVGNIILVHCLYAHLLSEFAKLLGRCFLTLVGCVGGKRWRMIRGRR